jgi:hypothetical protein
MPFQPRYGDAEQRLEHLEREFIRLGQSGKNPNQQAQGAGGSSATVVVGGGGSPPSTIPESQVVFDDTGGHDHSAGNSTAVPMAGDVTGTNQAAVVTALGDVTGTIGATSVDKLHGKTVPTAPGATDTGKALRYDNATGYVLQTSRRRIRTVTTTDTFGANDDTIVADATGAAFSVNLPAVATSARLEFCLKRSNAGANNVTLQANAAETIDGANTYVLTVQYQAVTVQCDGAVWWIVAKV